MPTLIVTIVFVQSSPLRETIIHAGVTDHGFAHGFFFAKVDGKTHRYNAEHIALIIEEPWTPCT